MSLPRLFDLGIMPVKFAYSDEPLLSRTLILSDKIWQASFENEFEVQPILFDNGVCFYRFSFGSPRPLQQLITPSFRIAVGCTTL